MIGLWLLVVIGYWVVVWLVVVCCWFLFVGGFGLLFFGCCLLAVCSLVGGSGSGGSGSGGSGSGGGSGGGVGVGGGYGCGCVFVFACLCVCLLAAFLSCCSGAKPENHFDRGKGSCSLLIHTRRGSGKYVSAAGKFIFWKRQTSRKRKKYVSAPDFFPKCKNIFSDVQYLFPEAGKLPGRWGNNPRSGKKTDWKREKSAAPNYQPTINNQKPTTKNQQPKTNNQQQPTTSNQKPATKNQQPKTKQTTYQPNK